MLSITQAFNAVENGALVLNIAPPSFIELGALARILDEVVKVTGSLEDTDTLVIQSFDNEEDSDLEVVVVRHGHSEDVCKECSHSEIYRSIFDLDGEEVIR